MRSRKCIGDDNRTVLPEAYFRRDNDTDGLSVETTESSVRDSFPGLKGIAKLSVKGVRGIVNPFTNTALDVVLDSPTHGNITGVPYRSQDSKTAEYLAGNLARISELV